MTEGVVSIGFACVAAAALHDGADSSGSSGS
jgi:hypothetical protein